MSLSPSGLIITLTVLAAAVVFLAVMLEKVHGALLDLREEYEDSLSPCCDGFARDRIDQVFDDLDALRSEVNQAHNRLDAGIRDVVELQHVVHLSLPNKILTVEAGAAASRQAVDRLGEMVARIERLAANTKLAPSGRRKS